MKPSFSTQADCKGNLEKAQLDIECVLRVPPTLLAVDNMASVLLPEFLEKVTPDAHSDESRKEWKAILDVCQRLLKGVTRG